MSEEKYNKGSREIYPESGKDDNGVSSSTSPQLSERKLVGELVKAIEEYQPPERFNKEQLYHANLYAYLHGKVSTKVIFEKQGGSSRPDLELGDIAIEVRGPTRDQDIRMIADSMPRYSQHYNYIIIVLFDIRLPEAKYQDWYKGIMRQYEGKVTIIRKDSFPTEDLSIGTIGHCIRCGDIIARSLGKPLCQKCYTSWVKSANERHPEKYCHICGAMSKLSYSKPVCYSCYKKTQQ